MSNGNWPSKPFVRQLQWRDTSAIPHHRDDVGPVRRHEESAVFVAAVFVTVIGVGRRGDGCTRTRHAQRPRKLVVRGTIDNDFNELARREVERQDGIIMKRGDRERRIPYDNELLGAPQAVDKRCRFGVFVPNLCGALPRGARRRLVEGRRHEG